MWQKKMENQKNREFKIPETCKKKMLTGVGGLFFVSSGAPESIYIIFRVIYKHPVHCFRGAEVDREGEFQCSGSLSKSPQ